MADNWSHRRERYGGIRDIGPMSSREFRRVARSRRIPLSFYPLCPEGVGVGKWREAPGTLPPGPCEYCDLYPLHGPRHAGSGCGCSFIRDKRRVCRKCAVVSDLVTKGRTKIVVKDMPDAEWISSIAFTAVHIWKGSQAALAGGAT